MKWYIKAMSLGRKDMMYKLNEVSYPLVKHLIKYFTFCDNESRDHWYKEICSFLNHISYLKSGNKFLSSKDIFYSLWEMNTEKRFSIMYRDVLGDYDYEPEEDEETVKQFVIEYLKWLSEMLSIYGSVNRKMIEDELDTIEGIK